MVEIGNMPILWHIMNIYEKYGINDFIICLGYKGYMIKEFFQNYLDYTSGMKTDLQHNKFEIHKNKNESWKITFVDTGEKSMTGGRIKRIQEHINDTFCVTYGDGLIDMNINDLISFHKSKKSSATLATRCCQDSPRRRLRGSKSTNRKITNASLRFCYRTTT